MNPRGGSRSRRACKRKRARRVAWSNLRAQRAKAMLTQQAAIAANRFGLGARPRDAAAIGSDPKGWLEEQVASTKRSTPAKASPPSPRKCSRSSATCEVVRQAAAQARASAGQAQQGRDRRQRRRDRVARYRRGRDQASSASSSREHYLSQVNDRHRRAIESDQPFIERLVHFWSNHFAVSADKPLVAPLAGALRAGSDPAARDRQLLRPAARGRAASRDEPLPRQHDVDGRGSTARAARAQPRPRARPQREPRARDPRAAHARRRRRLHAARRHRIREGDHGLVDRRPIGPRSARRVKPDGGNGGARAAVRRSRGKPGEFYFRALMHEPGDKTRARQDATRSAASRKASKCSRRSRRIPRRRSISRPSSRATSSRTIRPPRSSTRLATAYLQERRRARARLSRADRADESWRQPLAKYKTPQDFVHLDVSRARSRARTTCSRSRRSWASSASGRSRRGSPAGWPDTAASWDGGDALLKRIEWGGAVGKRVGAPRRQGASTPRELAAPRARPGQRRDAREHPRRGRAAPGASHC